MTRHDDQMFSQQIRILYERAISVIPVNIIIGGILCLFLLPVMNLEELLSWWALLLGISAVRFFYVKYTLRKGEWVQHAQRLCWMFAFLGFLTGCIWSSAFLLFAFSVPDVYLIFIIFALGGMSVGAIASMATSKINFFAYTLPMLVPPALVFLVQGGALGYAMSSMITIYAVSITLTYMQSYNMVLKGIQNQFEKDELIQHLKISKQHLELANEKIMVISHTDELTQVGNRRYLDMMLVKEWARSLRSHFPITYIMIDIDFFKDYNDKFGHQQGDHCLQRIAALLKNMIKRPGDFVARYGGEEFAVMLPETELSGAYTLMSDLQQALGGLQIPAGNTKVNAFVTISIGIACITPKPGDDMHKLITGADSALYAAKTHGRNRIEMINLSV